MPRMPKYLKREWAFIIPKQVNGSMHHFHRESLMTLTMEEIYVLSCFGWIMIAVHQLIKAAGFCLTMSRLGKTTVMDTTCTKGWKSIRKIIFFSSITRMYLPRITKLNGCWENIKENRRRLCHSGVRQASTISVNAWACWFWCTEKSRPICSARFQKYLHKKTDGFDYD